MVGRGWLCGWCVCLVHALDTRCLVLPLPPPARPVVVNIGRAGMATDNVTQRVIMVKENEKPHRCDSGVCF